MIKVCVTRADLAAEIRREDAGPGTGPAAGEAFALGSDIPEGDAVFIVRILNKHPRMLAGKIASDGHPQRHGAGCKRRFFGRAFRHLLDITARHILRFAVDQFQNISVPACFDRQIMIPVAHHGDTGPIAGLFRVQIHLDRPCEIKGLHQLRQEVSRVEKCPRPRDAAGVEPQRVGIFGHTVPFRAGIGLPLPLQTELVTREIIGSIDLRLHDGQAFRHRSFQNRLSTAVFVLVNTHQRPVIDPANRLQMRDAAVRIHILEMDEIILAVRRIHPAALVRAVYIRGTLVQHDFFFIRTFDIARAQDQLPTGFDAARRAHDIVIAVSLVDLRPLRRGMPFLLVENLDAAVDDLGAVRVHTVQIETGVNGCAASRPGMDQIHLAVVVKKHGRIDPAGFIRRVSHPPGTGGICRRKGQKPFVRRTYIHVEGPVMITDARRPGAFPVVRVLIGGERQ